MEPIDDLVGPVLADPKRRKRAESAKRRLEKQQRKADFVAVLCRLETTIMGYGDPQYPEEYRETRRKLLALFDEVNR